MLSAKSGQPAAAGAMMKNRQSTPPAAGTAARMKSSYPQACFYMVPPRSMIKREKRTHSMLQKTYGHLTRFLAMIAIAGAAGLTARAWNSSGHMTVAVVAYREVMKDP